MTEQEIRPGSGTTSGAGFGNKTTNSTDQDNSDTRLNLAKSTSHYSNPTEYGSGTTAGVGHGNKTTPGFEKQDSTAGKLMEKVGGLLHQEGLVTKGHEKREAAGYGKD